MLAAGAGDDTAAREALAALCRSYWYPLYAYARRRGHLPHDAEDLIQGFFGQFLEHNWVARADQQRGRFRTFLLTALDRFLANEWDKIRAIKRGGQLRQHGYASSTPATDGERVFVFFGKTGVLAFDRDGKQLWQTSVGTGSAIMGWGSAASIVLYKNLVIVNANAESQAIVALDKQTGSEVWRTEAKGYTGSWSTPTLVDVPGGKQELVLFVPEEVWGLDPEDGGLYWYATGVRGTPTSTPVARDGVVYIAAGGPRGAGATAIRAGGSGDVTDTHVLWKQSVGPYVPSPVVFEDHIYWVDDRGIAYCIKAADGQPVYRERLPDGGEAYASVVAADGKLYAVTRRNGTFVLAAGPEFKVLAHNRLESDSTDFNATPAVAGGALLLRSNQALYCIRAQ